MFNLCNVHEQVLVDILPHQALVVVNQGWVHLPFHNLHYGSWGWRRSEHPILISFVDKLGNSVLHFIFDIVLD